MGLKPCLSCGRLSDQARCPTHRRQREHARDERRGTTTQRSYGSAHQQRREQLLPHAYGQPCDLCGNVMLKDQTLDLDHTDPADKQRGLPGDRIVHAKCNRGRKVEP